jgi:hypothetical protein
MLAVVSWDVVKARSGLHVQKVLEDVSDNRW